MPGAGVAQPPGAGENWRQTTVAKEDCSVEPTSRLSRVSDLPGS